jgi:hypothetical protein
LNWLNCLQLRVELLRRLPGWLWLLKLLHCDWILLIVHKLWLPEVQAKLVQHWGGDTYHCLLLSNSGNILLGFWAPFGAISSSVILSVEVWISWVVVCEFRGSSSPSPSPGCKSSSCAWFVVLIGLMIFYIVDVSWILGLRSPRHFSFDLSCFVSFSYSCAVILIVQDVLFKFMEKFIDCLGFLSCQVWSSWSWSQTLDQCFDCCFVIPFRNLGSLVHESSYEVP